MEISSQQAAIILGLPAKQIKAGVRGNWVGMQMEVAGVTGDAVQIKRLAFDMVPQGDTPTAGTDERFHELDMWNDGAPHETDRGGGGVLTKPKLGPVDPKQLKPVNPGQPQGGDSEEKVDILGPELKSPRDQRFPFTNPTFEQPGAGQQKWSSKQDALEILQNIKRLRVAEGIDTPLIAVKDDKSPGVKT